MGRAHTETSTLGWLLPRDANESFRRPAERQASDNWPIPLVVRREPAAWKEISADWFDAAERISFANRAGYAVEEPVEEHREPYRVVSRWRLRLAHALFALLFLALLALAAWEAHIYFGFGNPADYFR